MTSVSSMDGREVWPLNTCPRWAPDRTSMTSVRGMKGMDLSVTCTSPVTSASAHARHARFDCPFTVSLPLKLSRPGTEDHAPQMCCRARHSAGCGAQSPAQPMQQHVLALQQACDSLAGSIQAWQQLLLSQSGFISAQELAGLSCCHVEGHASKLVRVGAGCVSYLLHMLGVYGSIEARPPCPAVKLGVRREQREPADGAHVHALLLVVMGVPCAWMWHNGISTQRPASWMKKDASVGNLSHSSTTYVSDLLLACSCGVLGTQVLHGWPLSEASPFTVLPVKARSVPLSRAMCLVLASTLNASSSRWACVSGVTL